MKNRLIKISLYKKNNKNGLTYVIEKQIPFKIKRVFFKYKFKESGNHINKITNMALICVSGKISVFIKNKKNKKKYILDRPDKLLFIHKKEWRKIVSLKKNTIVVYFCSEKYLKNEYIYD